MLSKDIVKPSDSDIKRVAEEGICYNNLTRQHINYFRHRKGFEVLSREDSSIINNFVVGSWYYEQCKEYIKDLEEVI